MNSFQGCRSQLEAELQIMCTMRMYTEDILSIILLEFMPDGRLLVKVEANDLPL